MEEVDNIIIHSLKAIGCDIDEEVQTVAQFTTNLVIQATVKCLRLIKNDVNISESLPSGMSARFRACTTLAQYISELGYGGEIGYQSFLYSQESDVRKMLIFLIEKLPRAQAELTEETIGSSARLHESISNEFATQLSSPWVPRYLTNKSIVWRGHPPSWKRVGASDQYFFHSSDLVWPHETAKSLHQLDKEKLTYYKKLPLVTDQPPNHHDVAASILEDHGLVLARLQAWESEWNIRGLATKLSKQQYLKKKREKLQKRIKDNVRSELERLESGHPNSHSLLLRRQVEAEVPRDEMKRSRFTHTANLQVTSEEKQGSASIADSVESKENNDTKALSPEEQQKMREAEMEKLANELEKLRTTLDQLSLANEKFSSSRVEAEESTIEEKQTNEESKEEIRLKRKIVDLLPNAEENIAKLESIVEKSELRMKSLGEQWDEHRLPLEARLKELEEASRARQTESERMLEEMREMRDRMKELADDTRYKDDLHKQLVSDYEKMTKDVNRSAYTRKILEIVANIKKQSEDIDKILLDTRALQKDINSLQGNLNRTFAVADELIFKDAKKDVDVKRAYKYLAALHENCDQLIDVVEETGLIMREIRDLEDQVEKEQAKNTSDSLKQITNDYNQIKAENASLIKHLKEKSK